MKPAIVGLRRLVDRARTAAAPAPSSDEDDGEAGDERDAGDDDPPRPTPRLAELVHLDRRDGRQVAGHERQHAGRDHGEEPREERDRKLLDHRVRCRSERAPGRPGARGSAQRRLGRRVVVGRLRRRGSSARSRAPTPDRRGAEHDRRERQQPREQVEAARLRHSEHLRPELGDRSSPRSASSSSPPRSARGSAPSSAAPAASSTRRAARGRSCRRAPASSCGLRRASACRPT